MLSTHKALGLTRVNEAVRAYNLNTSEMRAEDQKFKVRVGRRVQYLRVVAALLERFSVIFHCIARESSLDYVRSCLHRK